MDSYKRDFFIARIRAGYIPVKMNEQRFIVHHPDLETALHSQEIYMDAYEKGQDKGLMTDDELVGWLIDQGLWSSKIDNEFEVIVPGHIEYWKIELYTSSLKSNTRKAVRKYLAVAKEEYNRLHNLRHFYDYVTIEGYASYVRSLFTISECTRLNDKPVDWEQYSLHKLMGLYHQEMLQPEQVRLLSRTTPWLGLWGVLKTNGNIFGTSQITVEQQSLLSWSTMYDKIYESPDCPSDEVIEDDDMLDGWLLVQKRKREADKKKQEIEGHINPKMKNSDEIYMMAETATDAQKIDMLNPDHIQKVKKQRLKQIKEKGQVKEQEFKDVQQKRSMDMHKAFVQSVKGRQ